MFIFLSLIFILLISRLPNAYLFVQCMCKPLFLSVYVNLDMTKEFQNFVGKKNAKILYQDP